MISDKVLEQVTCHSGYSMWRRVRGTGLLSKMLHAEHKLLSFVALLQSCFHCCRITLLTHAPSSGFNSALGFYVHSEVDLQLYPEYVSLEFPKPLWRVLII